jgi:hypothetical protein
MSSVLIWGFVGTPLGGALAALIAAYDEPEGADVIAGDFRLSEDQVRGQGDAYGPKPYLSGP